MWIGRVAVLFYWVGWLLNDSWVTNRIVLGGWIRRLKSEVVVGNLPTRLNSHTRPRCFNRGTFVDSNLSEVNLLNFRNVHIPQHHALERVFYVVFFSLIMRKWPKKGEEKIGKLWHPETNSKFGPEKWWLEDSISFWTWPIFRGRTCCQFQGGLISFKKFIRESDRSWWLRHPFET